MASPCGCDVLNRSAAATVVTFAGVGKGASAVAVLRLVATATEYSDTVAGCAWGLIYVVSLAMASRAVIFLGHALVPL